MKPWNGFEAMENAGGPAEADTAMAALLEAWRRDGRRLIEDQWVEFSELARQVERLVDLNLYVDAAAAAQVAANYAVFWHTGVFSSPTLDRALFVLGRAALSATGLPERPRGSRLRVLHVATQVGAIGGHARMLWRWIAQDAGNIHTVALTRQTGPVPDALFDSVAETGGCIHQVNRRVGGLLRWAKELQALMQEQDLVVLHVHNQDVIPFIAMAGLQHRPRVLLLNHADHVFWLGAGLVDLVVNTRQSGRGLCSARRGISAERNLLMPLCLEPIKRGLDRAAAKRRLGLPEDSIVLLTVARAVKFRTIGGLSYADAFVPLLRRNPRLRLVAVGPGDVEDWSAARKEAPGQIIAYGERPDTGAFFEAADVYVDSFPFISNTSMLEAGLHEAPVITRYPFGPGCEVMGADSVGIDTDLIRATGLRDFHDKLNALIDDMALRKEIGRRTKANLEAINTGDGWSAALATVYERAFAIPQRTLEDVADKAPRFDDVDLFSPFVFGTPLAEPSAAARQAPAMELALKTMPTAQRVRIWLRMTRNREFVFRPKREAWRYLVPEWVTVRAFALRRNNVPQDARLQERASFAIAGADGAHTDGAAEPRARNPGGSCHSKGGAPTRQVEAHVLFCADPHYFQHAAVAAVSLATSSRCDRIHVHVITCDRDPVSEGMLRDSLVGFPKVVLDIHQVDASRLSGVFVDKHLSKEAYLRFLAAEVLPETLDRVVYLDCDLVVLDDIFELYGADLNGMAIGAVEDARWADGATESRLVRLGARPSAPYVNSGVLVLDLDTWRRENLARDLFAFVAEHGSLLLRHDQDALNVVLQDRIQLLDKRWNVQTLMFSPAARKMLLLEDEAAKQARRHPGIIHYSTGSKPWAFRAAGRRKHIYFRFREATAWRAARPQLDSLAQRIEYDVAKALLKLRLNVYAPLALYKLAKGALATLRGAFENSPALARTRFQNGNRP